METRILGRTGEQVRCFGFGGIMLKGMEQAVANRLVAEAVDRGVNYFDVAPSYGNAEEVLGPALAPFRKNVLLACKTGERTKDKAAKQLRDSLRKLRTDCFDVYQLHGIEKADEIKTALGPGGALEAFLEAKEEGLVRFIGFSTHSQQAALTLLESFDFDTVMFPCNFAYWLKGGAGEAVLRRAAKSNMGRIAIKALAHRPWRKDEERAVANCWYKPIFDDRELADLALRFILSQDVHVAISPGDPQMLRLGMDIADQYRPLTTAEMRTLQAKADEIDYIFSGRY